MMTAQTLPPRREPNLDRVSASLPCGVRERIKATAAAERMTAGDFLRRTILQAVAPDLLTVGR